MSDRLTLEEQRIAEEFLPVARRVCAGFRGGRAFSVEDLQAVAIAEMVETIIRCRGTPMISDWHRFASLLRTRCQWAVYDFLAQNSRVLTAPTSTTQKARRGEMPEFTRRLLLGVRRQPMHAANERQTQRCGRGNFGLPLRVDEPDEPDVDERLTRLRAAFERAAAQYHGPFRQAADLLIAEWYPCRSADRLSRQEIADRCGLENPQVQRLIRSLAEDARAILEGRPPARRGPKGGRASVALSAADLAQEAGRSLYAAQWAILQAASAFPERSRTVAMLSAAARLKPSQPMASQRDIAKALRVSPGVAKDVEARLIKQARRLIHQEVAA